MNPLEALIQQLSQNAGPRGFTFAGRPAQSGMSLGDILSMRGTVGDLEEGNAKPLFQPLSKDAGKFFIPTNSSVVNQYKNTASNIMGLSNAGNAENIPTFEDIKVKANEDQAGILNRIQELYNYLFPYNLNTQDFFPRK